jgi:branched-chain amino acid transport system permease protein
MKLFVYTKKRYDGMYVQVLQAIITGLLIGGIYSLVSVGANIVWGVMRIVNFAHGAMIILSSYVAYLLFTYYGVDPILSLLLSAPLFFLIGVALQLGFVESIRIRVTETEFDMTTLLIFFGLSVILESLMIFFFTSIPRAIQISYFPSASLNVLGLNFPILRLMTFIISLIVLGTVAIMLKKTRLGKAIRATSEDREAASIVGINVSRISMVAFGIGAMLAAVAGVFIALSYPFSTGSSLGWCIKAFIVVVLGGIGSIPGAVIGSMILGIVESVAATFFGMVFREAGSLIIFILVITCMPKGLLGRR